MTEQSSEADTKSSCGCDEREREFTRPMCAPRVQSFVATVVDEARPVDGSARFVNEFVRARGRVQISSTP
eukprot:6174591-Pleurochrysis_carterae.AAC.1